MKSTLKSFVTYLVVAFLLLGVALILCTPSDGRAASAAYKCPKVAAHRGYSAKYPENTPIAVEKALNVGAQYIENDVHFSKSNVPFVTHDATSGRVTNDPFNRAWKDLWWSEINALDFGYPDYQAPNGTFPFRNADGSIKYPSPAYTFFSWLSDVKAGGAKALVEMKATGVTETQWNEFNLRITQAGFTSSNFLFQSFDRNQILKFQELRPGWPTMWLHSSPPLSGYDEPSYIVSGSYIDLLGGYSADYRYVTPAMMAYWKASSVSPIAVWTPDSAADWEILVDMGPDIIITNEPSKLETFLDTANCW